LGIEKQNVKQPVIFPLQIEFHPNKTKSQCQAGFPVTYSVFRRGLGSGGIFEEVVRW
jgi:hypothetical protein